MRAPNVEVSRFKKLAKGHTAGLDGHGFWHVKEVAIRDV